MATVSCFAIGKQTRLFSRVKKHLRSDIPVYEAELNINDPAFSARAVELLLGLMSEEA